MQRANVPVRRSRRREEPKRRTGAPMRAAGAGLIVTAVVIGACLLAALPSPTLALGDRGPAPAWAERVGVGSTGVDLSATACAGHQAVVMFKEGVPGFRAWQVTAAYGLTVDEVLTLASEVRGQKIAVVESGTLSSAQIVAKLRNDPAVAMVGPNHRLRVASTVPNDPLFDDLWGLNNTAQSGGTDDADIDAPEAWDLGTGSASIVVADLDTGIDYTHEDLVANVWTNPGETPGNGMDDDGNGYVDDVYGIDTVSGDSDPWDDDGHGTHTAGTIAAVGDNGVGVAGVGWSTKVMGVKFLDEDGWGTDAAAIEAIYYVIDHKVERGVDVVAINASWGGTGYNPLLEQAIADAWEAGIVFVAAAGNDYADIDARPYYPACYDVSTIVTVGATDHDDAPTWFTNSGATSVDLFAPGEEVLSTVPDFSYVPVPGDLFYDGLEAGPGLWSAVEGSWAITGENPKAGTRSWSDSPGGDYVDDADTAVVTSAVDLTLAPARAQLGFSVWYDLGQEYVDALVVDMSADGGTTWEQQLWLGGSSLGSWESYYLPIPAEYCTSQFKARFRLVTSSDDGAVYDGVYVDDVGIGARVSSATYESWSGTSMAAPHVTGALAVLAALYPAETPLELVNRIRSGVDVLSQLEGLCNTGGRLNVAGSIAPDLVQAPWVMSLSPRSGVGAGTELVLEGAFFGSGPGTVSLVGPSPSVEAEVLSWQTDRIVAVMPDTSNCLVVLQTADGRSATAGPVSAWTPMESSILTRDGNVAVEHEGVIYSFGGYTQGGQMATDTGETFDTTTGSWSATSKLTMPGRRVHAAAAGLDGLIYVCGGYDDYSHEAHDTMWVYDPVVGRWSTLAPMPAPLMFHCAVALDGKIWVFSGKDADDNPNLSLYAYDPVAGSWSTYAGPSTPRIGAGALALDGQLYLWGGMVPDTEEYTASAERYDPSTDTWSPAPDLPAPLARMGVAEYEGMVYLTGGTATDWWYGGTRTVLRYDPAVEEWLDMSGMIQALPYDSKVHSSPAVGVPGQGIYSLNGFASRLSSRRLALLGDAVLSLAITSLDPAAGSVAGGSPVTITGTGFIDVTEVTFDGIAADFTVDSPTQITAEAPAHAAGSVQVLVRAGGRETEDTPADDYTYAEAPTVTALEPVEGPASGGQTVVITGTGFLAVTAVTFSGTAAESFTVDSDTSITVVTPEHAAGPARVEVTAAGGPNADTPGDDYLYYEISYSSVRGTDRFDTAIRISRAMFPGPLPAGAGLVLAPGETFQEALCGAPLAAAYGGPVLLTPKVGLNNAVKAEILRLAPAYVICIGLSDSIKNAVQAALGSTGTASVIRGTSVYQMSYKVAKALGAKVGSMAGAVGIVTRGDMFPDAIGVSPLACLNRWPVLLTGSTDTPSIYVTAAVAELGINKAIKVGTYAKLPAGVTGLANLSGADRYATNRNVAEWGKGYGSLSFVHLGIATGDKFPDALAAGPYLALDRGILLLSPLFGPLPSVIGDEIAENSLEVRTVSFLAMIEPVIGQVKALLP